MSIQSEINRIKANVADAYTELEGKGATMPLSLTSDELAATVRTVTEQENLDAAMAAQDSLILQIQNALEGKAAGGSADPILQEKTVSPTTSQQTVTPDSNYDGLSKVTVNAMPTATQATPSISVSSGGLITASSTQSAGYVTAGTKSATKQLTVQAAKTITPSTSSQTAVASGRYTTGTVTVAAIPSSYVQPSGTKSITTNGTHDVKSYASVSVNVASTGEDVTEETFDYTTLLHDLENVVDSLPEAGSGGGSVETCTVTVTSFAANMSGYEYVSYENGEYTYHKVLPLPAPVANLTLNNCVKGSYVQIQNNYDMCSWIPSDENTFIYFDSGFSSLYCVPIDDSIITVIDDD